MIEVSFSGDETIEDIIDTYGNSILRLAHSYLKNLTDAEDILQDTLLQYIKVRPRFESNEHQKAWFLRVAINLCKNCLKSSWWKKRSEIYEDIVSSNSLCEDELEVLKAVNSLPLKYREVIHLFYYEGYPTAEIAKILLKNESTIRSLLLRARNKLKDQLKEVYDFHE